MNSFDTYFAHITRAEVYGLLFKGTDDFVIKTLLMLQKKGYYEQFRVLLKQNPVIKQRMADKICPNWFGSICFLA